MASTQARFPHSKPVHWKQAKDDATRVMYVSSSLGMAGAFVRFGKPTDDARFSLHLDQITGPMSALHLIFSWRWHVLTDKKLIALLMMTEAELW